MAIKRISTAIFILLYVTHCAHCISSKSWQNPEAAASAAVGTIVPEPRAYLPDAGALDFVYHDYDEMTRFLR